MEVRLQCVMEAYESGMRDLKVRAIANGWLHLIKLLFYSECALSQALR